MTQKLTDLLKYIETLNISYDDFGEWIADSDFVVTEKTCDFFMGCLQCIINKTKEVAVEYADLMDMKYAEFTGIEEVYNSIFVTHKTYSRDYGQYFCDILNFPVECLYNDDIIKKLQEDKKAKIEEKSNKEKEEKRLAKIENAKQKEIRERQELERLKSIYE